MHYLIGTSLENYESMKRDGVIKTNPPHRVWKEYSEDYVYLIPSEPAHLDDIDMDEHFRYAAEQASFCLYELGHKKRVVLKIENIDDELLEEDPDATCINAVRYPNDIPFSCITDVYLEDNGNLVEIQEMIAINKVHLYLRNGGSSYVLSELAYLDEEELTEQLSRFEKRSGLKYLHHIQPHYFEDSEAMSDREMELIERVELEPTFFSMLTSANIAI